MLNAATLPTVVVPFDHEYDEPPVAVTLIAVVEQVKIVEFVLFVIPAVGKGETVTANVLAVEVPQEFCAVTLMLSF